MWHNLNSQVNSSVKYLKESLFFKEKNSLSLTEMSNFVDKLSEAKNQFFIADKVTPICILGDNKTIYTKNSGLVQVIKLEGKDYSGISRSEQEELFSYRKRFFETLSSEITITFHYQRKKIKINQDLTGKASENKHIDEVSKLWYSKFKGAYKTEIYLVVRTNLSSRIDVAEAFKAEDKKDLFKINKKKEELESEISKISKLLEPYNPKTLTHTKDNKSPIITFFDYVINNDLFFSSHEGSLRITQNNDIGSLLALSDLTFDKDERIVTLHHEQKKKFCQILALKFYPDETHPQMFENLLRIKHQFNVVQHVLPVDKEFNKLLISKKIKQLLTMSELGFMGSRMADLSDAGEALERGEINFHNHIVLVYVYGNTKEELLRSVRDVQNSLNNNGITLVSEKSSIELAYWSQLPDYEKLNTARKVKASTQNLADFITIGTSLEGYNSCAFGDMPVATFKTIQNTNYSFTFHNSTAKEANGHTMIIGGTGAGKTTLISFLLMNCLKYDKLKILCFDSLNGLKVPTTVFGGEYIDSGKLSDFNLNPFLLPDNPQNKSFLIDFLEILIKKSRNGEEKRLLEEAIKQGYQLNPNERNLGIVRSIFPKTEVLDNGEETIISRIRTWLPAAEKNSKNVSRFGNLFNAKRDALSFEKRIVSFDMVNALKNEELLAPLSSYIFYAFEEHINKHVVPHICFIDEMANYIRNDTFRKFILRAAQEWRKRRGIFIGAVQQASIITATQEGRDLIKNLATYILFPDVTASASDYMECMGLNDSEFEWIKTPNSERQVMIKRRGGESVIIDVNLSLLGNNLNLFSSSFQNVDRLIRIENEKKQKGSESLDLVEEYLKRSAL